MLRRISIGSKITTLLIFVVLITVFAISFLAFNFSRNSIKERYLENLNIIADLKVNHIETYFDQIRRNSFLVKDMEVIKNSLSAIKQSSAKNNDTIPSFLASRWDRYLLPFKNTYKLNSIIVTNTDGKILYTTDKNNPSHTPGNFFNDPDGNILTEAKKATYLSKAFTVGEKVFMILASPMLDEYNTLSGILLFQIDMDQIYQIVQDNKGLGKTGEILLGKTYNNKILYINPLRHDSDAVMRKGVYLGESNSGYPIQEAVGGRKGAAEDVDYRGINTLATWRYIPIVDWGLVVKIDTDEIYAEANILISRFFTAGTLIVLLSLMIALIFSRFLINPILSLKSTIGLLGQGVLPDKVEKKSDDEIGKMAETLNHLVQALKRTANFAHKIGEGDFDADFKPMSENDTLGTALLSMRDSIQEAEKRDHERNWIVTGVAEIGEILRSNDSLDKLGDEVIAYITNKINAIQGAFYVVNDDDKEDIFIEMKSSFAYNKKKYLNGKFKFAEGLIGQSAIEQDTLLRTEIPDEYVSVTSGILGDQRPKCILVVPLITDEKVFGVLEFAGFTKFDPTHVKFVQEISLIIARTIFNIKVNERTRRLLEESQKMSTELQIQQEILRQNAEEMEATQEELYRTNHRLEDQIEEVNRTQKRMQLLLENASEVITIYEADGIVRYISPSVEKILGYSQNEMIGKSDIAFVHKESVDVVNNMFQSLLNNPFEPITIQYIYKKKDGDEIWIESTGKNLLKDAAIKGILINARDITERKRAEMEQRMRSQMQALSENSPDLITRLNTEGKFFYINPVIELYTGLKPEQLLNKSLADTDLPKPVVERWLQILEEVINKNKKINLELELPSTSGERIVQLNAIPEYGEDSKIESVLMVSHDITERKLIELEIQTKNKKITESINYAKRIQGAILPNNYVISKALPESFILYKAKDVVSGDFPWFMQVGDDIYIAAVDCTGHGVPGALISLIGYFLLNDIVRSRRITDPGQILDLLDEGVTETLRQDQDDSKTKDGMDIAFCKINLIKQEVEYAGAHRPLYIIKENGELEEVKGNKFPIGGGKYKNQTNFTNTKFPVNKGDSIYFCSDGFPDQFGGDDNRKFGPKKLRSLIEENHKLPMQQIHDKFDQEWETWKGEQKQTDDVLLIGIRF
jgi:PAS domain S-box-containing protein